MSYQRYNNFEFQPLKNFDVRKYVRNLSFVNVPKLRDKIMKKVMLHEVVYSLIKEVENYLFKEEDVSQGEILKSEGKIEKKQTTAETLSKTLMTKTKK